MAWDVRRTYYYLVCFATLLMLIIGTVQLVQNILDLALPEEPYRPTQVEMRERLRTAPGEAPALSQEEFRRMTEEEVTRQERQQRRRALRNLLGNLALLGVAAPVYLYHWRQVRRTEPLDAGGATPAASDRPASRA